MCLTLSCALFLAGVFSSLTADTETAEIYYRTAQVKIKEGNREQAFQLLSDALKNDPKHGPSLIARGQLYLSIGKINKALKDFNRAVWHKDNRIRAQAYIGRGNAYRRMTNRNLQAMNEYRLALQADSLNCEAIYKIAQTGFALNDTQGYWAAADALSRLICLTPDYRDAYTLWREKIRDKNEEEIRQVDSCLEEYIAQYPEKGIWWLDLAWDNFRLREVERAFEALEKLEKAFPEHKPAERLLLKARCSLESGDTLGFENLYALSLQMAKEYDDFEKIYQETEPVFSSRESREWRTLKTPSEKDAFIRSFWKKRDPDPVSSHNERLINHYVRLREAENYYTQLFPHSRFQSSRDYRRLTRTLNLFWNRSTQLTLDQRGLLYLRHGPPDRLVQMDDFELKIKDPNELWLYKNLGAFGFKRHSGTGDYAYVRNIGLEGSGNIYLAMSTDSFRDILPAFAQDYYAVYFRNSDGKPELELYQSVPVGSFSQQAGPEATLAIYDRNWAEKAVTRTRSTRILTGTDSIWLAVHRLVTDSASSYYAMRMDIPGHRVVEKGSMELRPYFENKLDLGGVILGQPPEPDQNVHQRLGVKLLPRPSLTFSPNEIILAYLEVYGLGKDRQGRRSYREKVTISLVETEPKSSTSFTEGLKKLFTWDKERSISLTLTFDRQPDETRGPVADYFQIDTTNLVPGKYNLLVEVRDNSDGSRIGIITSFRITGVI